MFRNLNHDFNRFFNDDLLYNLFRCFIIKFFDLIVPFLDELFEEIQLDLKFVVVSL